ncbi:hypothetical protein LOD99_15633 [Oopsacas minuta]|uniref:Uncharacterized protein n=1 Tax=Oopsacas minuta TaxID=111878 RepID=A0AAV7KAQ4_9METZ|nr:hypothetical protein LOD99_15633 [Oopsacas minuta]
MKIYALTIYRDGVIKFLVQPQPTLSSHTHQQLISSLMRANMDDFSLYYIIFALIFVIILLICTITLLICISFYIMCYKISSCNGDIENSRLLYYGKEPQQYFIAPQSIYTSSSINNINTDDIASDITNTSLVRDSYDYDASDVVVPPPSMDSNFSEVLLSVSQQDIHHLVDPRPFQETIHRTSETSTTDCSTFSPSNMFISNEHLVHPSLVTSQYSESLITNSTCNSPDSTNKGFVTS